MNPVDSLIARAREAGTPEPGAAPPGLARAALARARALKSEPHFVFRASLVGAACACAVAAVAIATAPPSVPDDLFDLGRPSSSSPF
ncbi:hypothetical protein [Haloferula helveola]|uniref:hypothetical protein n=1 Tax=Haloferula helveola TaxID=490095 RepID=UPI0030B7B2AA